MNPTQENPRQENEPCAASAMPRNIINNIEGAIREHLDEVVTRTLSRHCFYIPGVHVLGDLLNDGSTRSFTWSGRSEILSVTTQVAVGTTVKESFTYDGLQRRISRTDATGTTFFIHDGWNVIAEYRRVGTTNVLQRRYLWGEDLSGSLQGAGGVGGLVQAVDYTSGNAGSYHYHYDGNVVEITNASATVAASYRYDAFGRTLVKAGTYADTNRYRFSTKPLELTSGLYYYGYRYYDPIHGRWTTRDPIGERDEKCLYRMLSNNEINSVDYLGLSECETPLVKDPNGMMDCRTKKAQCYADALDDFANESMTGLISGAVGGAVVGSGAAGVGVIPGAISGALGGGLVATGIGAWNLYRALGKCDDEYQTCLDHIPCVCQ